MQVVSFSQMLCPSRGALPTSKARLPTRQSGQLPLDHQGPQKLQVHCMVLVFGHLDYCKLISTERAEHGVMRGPTTYICPDALTGKSGPADQ